MSKYVQMSKCPRRNPTVPSAPKGMAIGAPEDNMRSSSLGQLCSPLFALLGAESKLDSNAGATLSCQLVAAGAKEKL